jgi:hypothetical protein
VENLEMQDPLEIKDSRETLEAQAPVVPQEREALRERLED